MWKPNVGNPNFGNSKFGPSFGLLSVWSFSRSSFLSLVLFRIFNRFRVARYPKLGHRFGGCYSYYDSRLVNDWVAVAAKQLSKST